MKVKKRFFIIIPICIIIAIISSLIFNVTNKINKYHQNDIVRLTPQQTALINQYVNAKQFIGTILVVKNGQPLFEHAYGYTNYQLRLPNHCQTSYPIASLQKAFTAALIMQQVKKHRLSLQDTLDKFYPQIPDSERITIQQMLDMTSGLYNVAKFNHHLHSDQVAINFYVNHVRVKAIGKWNYQAVNYHLLAGILTQITHQSYQQLVDDNIIKPLRLRQTTFMFDKVMLMRSYANKNTKRLYIQPIKPTKYLVYSELGTGNMMSNVNDLYTFENALITGQLLGKNTTQQLYNTQRLTYTGGLYPHRRDQQRYYTSYGLLQGYWGGVVISQNGQDAVIVLSNRYNNWMGVKKLYQQLFLTNTMK